MVGENEHTGICECCGEEKDDIIDGLCSVCEAEEYTYCIVCGRRISLDSAMNHRHVFETEYGEWYGTGGADMDEGAYEEVRQSLFSLLDHMGRRFARDLARTIENGHMRYDNLHTMTGLVLGPTMIFCFFDGGWRRKDKRFGIHSYGDKLHSIFTKYERSEDEVPFRYGFWWLFGLGEETGEENTQTLQWIAQWQAAHASQSRKETFVSSVKIFCATNA